MRRPLGLRVRISPEAPSLIHMTFNENLQPALDCPLCGDRTFRVVESRLSGTHRRRRKRCPCGYAQTTYEVTQEYFFEAESNAKIVTDLRRALGSLGPATSNCSSEKVVTCDDCVNLSKSGCYYQFPEAGGTFAAECLYFDKANV